jgi:hypothetical protein
MILSMILRKRIAFKSDTFQLDSRIAAFYIRFSSQIFFNGNGDVAVQNQG